MRIEEHFVTSGTFKPCVCIFHFSELSDHFVLNFCARWILKDQEWVDKALLHFCSYNQRNFFFDIFPGWEWTHFKASSWLIAVSLRKSGKKLTPLEWICWKFWQTSAPLPCLLFQLHEDLSEHAQKQELNRTLAQRMQKPEKSKEIWIKGDSIKITSWSLAKQSLS